MTTRIASRRHILLINPTITRRRNAKFPFAVLNLSAALDEKYDSSIIDGNVDRDFVSTTLRTLAGGHIDAVGISVMGGPQLRTAILVSQVIRARFPSIPIIWGGHFPTICATSSLNTPYVDFAVRAQGEQTLTELLDVLFGAGGTLDTITGLSWRRDGEIVHNANRPFSTAGLGRALPYERMGDPRQYFTRTFLGRRT
ncbi:MAG: radical protein, partial [Gammaproteobacteria bacterium]|nr:radical protein [Gammaproteobacteria bacterium]